MNTKTNKQIIEEVLKYSLCYLTGAARCSFANGFVRPDFPHGPG